MKREKLTHIVTFRLNDEQWVRLESAALNAGAKPNDWVRDLTIETLANGFALQPNHHFIAAQIARTQYLVGIGFQMLADDKLTTEEWKKLRTFAKEDIDVITERALVDFQSRTKGKARKVA